MSTQEQDLRLDILNTLLTSPHRELEKIWPVHRELIARDPRFYVRLAAWYADNGEVRDHKETFVVALVLSDFEGHRDVGLALLRQLPPYEVVRVVDFISGRKKTRKLRAGNTPRATRAGRRAAARRLFHGTESEPEADDTQPQTITEEFGLFRNVPRSVKTEIGRYLREREADPEWFDSSVLVALVEQTSPQELINSLGSLKRRGALELPEIKSMVDAKLEEAKTAKRVSALKTEQAITAADVSDEMRKKLEDVADTQIKAKGRITRPTALLIDKSASMEMAIELGKQIGAMISAICEKELYTYAFDTMAYEITPAGTDLADWERALSGITAGGCTSCGVPLVYLTCKRQYVEQIIMITDELQNTPPLFVPTFNEYRAELKTDPSICLVRTPGGGDYIEGQSRRAGVAVDVFQFTGDYYSLPNLVPMLSRPSKLELLMEIMDYPLPKRMSA